MLTIRHLAKRWGLLRRSRAEGFTLVEVLVALAILALSLTLILRTLSSGLFYQQRAKMLAEATLQAQSLLARIGADLPLVPGRVEGETASALSWQIEIAPYGDTADRRAWPAAAYTADVRVYAGRPSAEPLVQFTTIRLGPAAAER
jgi:general secretion pathway protein I